MTAVDTKFTGLELTNHACLDAASHTVRGLTRSHEKIPLMSEVPAKPLPTRKTGLSPKEQKLQALREKLAASAPGAPKHNANATGFKAKSSFTGKKTAFQRKAT